MSQIVNLDIPNGKEIFIREVYLNNQQKTIVLCFSEATKDSSKLLHYDLTDESFNITSQTDANDIFGVQPTCELCQAPPSEIEVVFQYKNVEEWYDTSSKSIEFEGEPYIESGESSVSICSDCHQELDTFITEVVRTNSQTILANNI